MDRPEIDLTNCEDEPIRVPGLIQPHGALIAAGSVDGVVSHASENLAEFLGVGPMEAIGRRLSDLVGEAASWPESAVGTLEDGSPPAYLLTAFRGPEGAGCEAIVHRAGGRIVLEFEPARGRSEATAARMHHLARAAVSALRRAPSLPVMYDECAVRVREISGFDRVMVYRFDDEWNGVVSAESRREDLEPFLGLHYPASDIPYQARELYARNWLRFIPDRDYEPLAILPACGPTSAEPLDLGRSVLRSVSPIHLQYLRNMGVGASMSISLLKGDRLWGLIACHHDSPRYVPYDVRTTCEMLAQVMSMQLAAREEQERSGYGERMQSIRAGLAARIAKTEEVALALTEPSSSLMEFLDATGAAVVVGGEVGRVGLTPGEDEILEVCRRLADRGVGDLFATDRLGAELGLEAVGTVAAGLLTVSITADGRDRVMWFRPEQVREVNWAGDPTKSVAKSDGAARLSPRGSFALWKQVVRGRCRPWSPGEVAAALDFRKDASEMLAARVGELAGRNRLLLRHGLEKEEMLAGERAARSEAERINRMKDEFVATLSHELRTPLAAILGWVHLLRRGGDGPGVEAACDVIERNTRAQVTMIEDLLDVSRIASGKLRLNVQPTSLAAAVAAAVESVSPTAEAKGIRIERIIGPDEDSQITGDPTRLQQIFWNLLTNAVKFTPKGGRVQVVVERVNSHVEVIVADSGQGISPEFLPHVFDRFRQQDAASNRTHGGLGLGLSIVRNLVEMHGGTIYARSDGEGKGAEFVVALPIRAVSRGGRQRGEAGAAMEDDSLDLGGVRILVLDDEADAREMIRRVLEERGAVVTAAASADQALEAYREGDFDAIVSDVGMPTVDGYEFIRRLRAFESSAGRPRRPAVALTAYARPEDRRRALVSGFQSHVAKPVEPAEVTAVVASLVGRI
jgi:light-regulated signal transduction histidine kinase (bacteriophytochrome)/ActR/RegA family two-component response regulator